ncbi:MAG: hypothetical protein M1840_002640 [Geoglossum simile]|nr:MAG: hypothetical protein M1840_002640 [Geoglossum simile]
MGKIQSPDSKRGEESPSSHRESEAVEMNTPTLPLHPVPCMQRAFEESIKDMPKSRPRKTRHEKVDAETRRRVLLRHEQSRRKASHSKKQGISPERYHTLWKLVAQIAFGIHLLHKQLAKSDAEVTKILQTHVDDLDEFVEDTTDDFELAQSDIEERIKNLRVPLEHLTVFDQMLDDREFRTQIIDGNEKIEYIINRTAAAMNRALGDISEGIKATDELARYLLQVDDGWENRSDGLVKVYAAMTSNVEGWYRCLVGLQMKGNSLGVALVKLGSIVAEMQKRAGMASRKNRVCPPLPRGSSTHAEPPLQNTMRLVDTPEIKRSSSLAHHKPLPTTPNPIHPAVQATLPRLAPAYGRAFPPDANFRHPAHIRNESIATSEHKSARASIHNTLSFYKNRNSTNSDPGSSSPLSPEGSEQSSSELRRSSKSGTTRVRPVPEQYPEPLAEKDPPNTSRQSSRRRSRLSLFGGSLRLKRSCSRASTNQGELSNDDGVSGRPDDPAVAKPTKRKSLLMRRSVAGIKELDGHVERAF